MALTNADKWQISVFTGIIFFIVANPMTFQLVQSLLGRFITVAYANGCPTMAGLVIHTLVFIVVLRLVM